MYDLERDWCVVCGELLPVPLDYPIHAECETDERWQRIQAWYDSLPRPRPVTTLRPEGDIL